jgi:hypothetical protein
MAVTRPLKEGSVTTYQQKVAAGFPDILASEMDADLDTIYAAWNGGVATANVNDGAITGAKLADAPNGILTAKINDLQVTNAKLADATIAAAKLAPGAAAGNLISARSQAIATSGANSTAAFTLFTGATTVIPAGRILRWEIGGQFNVASGVLQLSIWGAGSQLAQLPNIPVSLGSWRVQGLMGPKVSPTTDILLAHALEVWTGATGQVTPSATPAAVEGGAVHAVVGGNIVPLVLAGQFSVANASNNCSIFLGVSYLL